MSIEKNIKRLREENNLTQKELAKIAGVTDKAVSMWEQGVRVPRMNALQKMAERLCVKVSDIISDDSCLTSEAFCSIPLVRKLPVSYSKLLSADILSHLPVLQGEIFTGEKYVFYTLTEDNMSPLMQKGDTVLVHLKNFITSGRFAMLSIDNKEPIAAKIIFSGNEVKVLSEKEGAEDLIFSAEEFSRLKILGEIKKLIRNF